MNGMKIPRKFGKCFEEIFDSHRQLEEADRVTDTNGWAFKSWRRRFEDDYSERCFPGKYVERTRVFLTVEKFSAIVLNILPANKRRARVGKRQTGPFRPRADSRCATATTVTLDASPAVLSAFTPDFYVPL